MKLVFVKVIKVFSAGLLVIITYEQYMVVERVTNTGGEEGRKPKYLLNIIARNAKQLFSAAHYFIIT